MNSEVRGILMIAAAVVVGSACGNSQSGKSNARSPSTDYAREPARGPEDRVLGADNVPPGDKLQQGVHAGSDGVKPAAGWVADEHGLHRESEHQGGSAPSSRAKRVRAADAGR